MAEFSEVMRQARRMCASYAKCVDCPAIEACGSKGYFVINDIVEFERIVLNWVAENPEPQYPTWAEWHKENFPNASAIFTPCTFASTSELGCAKTNCRACKSFPIPADIAKKLGIRPKEV